MPRLTPVTPMPRESGRKIQEQIRIWFLSTASFNTRFDLFESLTCGHRRSAGPPLVDVVQDCKGPPVRGVGLERRDSQAHDASCIQAGVWAESTVPCKCEWCLDERGCPAGGGGLSVARRQPGRSEHCERGCWNLSDAGAARTCDTQVGFNVMFVIIAM